MKISNILAVATLSLLVSTSLFSQNLSCEGDFRDTVDVVGNSESDGFSGSISIKRDILVSISNLGTQNAKALVVVKSTQYNDEGSSIVDTQSLLTIDKNSSNFKSTDRGNSYDLKVIENGKAFYINVDKSFFNRTNKSKIVTVSIIDKTPTSLLKNLSGYPDFRLNCFAF
ncbi:MAG: hypothetical protein U0T83_10150 [Bacteriovoracaceae bacterium]